MADVGFVNSGASVADALQQILARKEKARHDSLLEQIAKQDSDTRQMLAAGQDEERKAMGAWRQAQADNIRRDDMVRGQTLSPEDATWLRNTGHGGQIESAPAYELPEGAQGPVPQIETYAGSAKEQLAAKQEAKQNALLGSPDFWEKSPLEQFLLARQAGLPNWNPDQFRKADAQHHTYVLDEATGQVKIADPVGPDGKPILPAADIHMTRSRPPRGPDPNIGNNWKFSDDGQFVLGLPTKGSNKPAVMRVQDLLAGMAPQEPQPDGSITPTPTTTFGKKQPGGAGREVPIIPNALIPKLATTTDKRARAVLVSGMLANSGASDAAKGAMQEYLNAAAKSEDVASLPPEVVLGKLKGLSDEDKQQFSMLLRVFRSGE